MLLVVALQNFVIAKVIALNLFALLFISLLYIHSWLLLCIALHIVIALPTVAIHITRYHTFFWGLNRSGAGHSDKWLKNRNIWILIQEAVGGQHCLKNWRLEQLESSLAVWSRYKSFSRLNFLIFPALKFQIILRQKFR